MTRAASKKVKCVLKTRAVEVPFVPKKEYVAFLLMSMDVLLTPIVAPILFATLICLSVSRTSQIQWKIPDRYVQNGFFARQRNYTVSHCCFSSFFGCGNDDFSVEFMVRHALWMMRESLVAAVT